MSWVEEFERDGFAVVEEVLDAQRVDRMISMLARESLERLKGRGVYARRNLLEVPEVWELAHSSAIRALVEPVLGLQARCVKGIFFDKTPEANWSVPWHRDRAIAVRERLEVEGYSGWSVKDGVPHVRPPLHVLRQMMTVRLHLDDCGLGDGPLRVIPGSHLLSDVSGKEAERLGRAGPEVACCVGAGGAVLMRPLTLHASSPMERPSHRRVIHLEFSAAELEGGLKWPGRNS